MADIADAANDYMLNSIDEALKNRAPKKATYYKYCRNCQEPTDGWQFCDSDCRDDFENRNK